MLIWMMPHLPDGKELDWFTTIKRLMVLDMHSSVPLVDVKFEIMDREVSAVNLMSQSSSTLIASALGGVDKLMDEILADSDGLGLIVHGTNTLLFYRLEQFSCLLIVGKSTEEARYRLELFASSFEELYHDELATFNGCTEKFSWAPVLVQIMFCNIC